ncbi:hypothetical protein V492_07911 [Pseudogymnoascus sp. VKM F-4246]|nr:hypothetical protein V492_07911 [Pseudogymnoascus sp. VKM F-4246]
MAHLHSAHPRVSLSKQFASFTNSTAGLDLTLRLVHALTLIAAEVCIDNDFVVACVTAASQLALGRRYLRLFSFIGCFERVRDVLAGDSPLAGSILTTMELVESSCLGLYLLLESLTMLHDMNIWLVSWYTPILIEGNKFWFYAICTSIARAVGTLLFGLATQGKPRNDRPDTDEKSQGGHSPSSPAPSTASLLKQIIANSCDLTLPASFLGWISLGDLGVGCAMALSTLLAWGDVWSRVQLGTHHAGVEESQEPSPPKYEQETEQTPPEYDPGPEPLPGYLGEISSLEGILQARRDNGAILSRDDATWNIETWRQYTEIYPPSTKPWDERDANENSFSVSSLFLSIELGKEELTTFLIENGMVTANTTLEEETPLLRAVTKKNVHITTQLLNLGADKDGLGSASKYYDDVEGIVHVLRTPLQHAASLGHLVLVKLLMETYHCDDSIVAPDGQIALRLAAENGHQEVVDYLPPRRLGGFRRWKHTHRRSLRRAKKALFRIVGFVEFFCWTVPKFFLWDIPKNTIVKPISRGCAWCWKNRKEFGPWCKQELLKLPKRVARFGKGVGRSLAKFPQACWKFGSKTLPGWVKRISIWLWEVVSKRFPKALGILTRWISSTIVSSAKGVWNVILKISSLLSTVVEAAISFLRRVTLIDVWNGFIEVLRAAFITFPRIALSWIEAFGETSYDVLKALLGTIGKILWCIMFALGWVIIYIPNQLWKIVKSFGESFMKAFHELRVWLNPKAG